MSAIGILLVLVGAALIVAEAHTPTYGLLGTGAALALASGIGLLVAGAGLGAAAVVAAMLSAAVFTAVLMAVVVRKGLATRALRPRGGADGLVGRLGEVRVAPEPTGQVFVDGALWRARLWALEEPRPLAPGDPVVVENVNGLTLTVRPAEEWEVLS
jgi:membrane-bound ClpP family serine protease